MRLQIRIWRNDLELILPTHNLPLETLSPRGDVMVWSEKSRRRLAFVVNNTDVRFRSMITLTYPSEFPSNGKLVKRHLHSFLDWLRKRHSSRRAVYSPFEYLWFLEFQKRGAAHLHVLLRPSVFELPEKHEISQEWYNLVGSGDSLHLAAGTRIERLRKRDAGARYATKYATKMHQKHVPEGYRDCGRFWACSAGVKPQPVDAISVDSLDEVKLLLETWPYRSCLDNPRVKTLYGAAKHLNTKPDST